MLSSFLARSNFSERISIRASTAFKKHLPDVDDDDATGPKSGPGIVIGKTEGAVNDGALIAYASPAFRRTSSLSRPSNGSVFSGVRHIPRDS